jgi:RNA polymerase sigma factor (sigma-70 family)
MGSVSITGFDPKCWSVEYGEYLKKFAYSKLNNREQVEDLVQDTFLTGIQTLDRFEGRSTIKTWLTSILKFKIMGYYRSGLREIPISKIQKPEMESHQFLDSLEAEQHRPSFKFQGTIPSAEDNLYGRQILAEIDSCLKGVNPKYKEVFELGEIQKMKVNQISEKLGLSCSNIWVIQHRVRAILKKELQMKFVILN